MEAEFMELSNVAKETICLRKCTMQETQNSASPRLPSPIHNWRLSMTSKLGPSTSTSAFTMFTKSTLLNGSSCNTFQQAADGLTKPVGLIKHVE